MTHGGFGQQGQGGVVEYRAVGHEHAAVAVAHVFAETDVGDDQQLGPALFEQAHGLLHNAVFSIGSAGLFVLNGRNAEQDHGREARIHGLGHLLFQLLQAELVLAGHGGNFFTQARVCGFHHKIGHDQVFAQEGRSFADQGAELRGPAQAAAPVECVHDVLPCYVRRAR